MAQWVADNYRQCRSGAMGGNAIWTVAAIRMDGGGVIAMDGDSGDGQQCQGNGWKNGEAIAMGYETVVARDHLHQCKSGAMGVWYFRHVFSFAVFTAR
jgi:hypothetical protein